jgi:hypothetical protein
MMPDSMLNKYTGEYVCADPEMKITVKENNEGLELVYLNSEKLYPVGYNTFFIMSLPVFDCVFIGEGNIINSFELRDGNRVIFKAVKR